MNKVYDIYNFICLLLFTQDSLFCWTSVNEGPAFLAKHLQRSLAEWLVIFTTEGLTEGLNSESFDTKLITLTGRPRIHMKGMKEEERERWHRTDQSKTYSLEC